MKNSLIIWIINCWIRCILISQQTIFKQRFAVRQRTPRKQNGNINHPAKLRWPFSHCPNNEMHNTMSFYFYLKKKLIFLCYYKSSYYSQIIVSLSRIACLFSAKPERSKGGELPQLLKLVFLQDEDIVITKTGQRTLWNKKLKR